MNNVCPVCLEDNLEEDNSQEFCNICIKNNCKIYNSCLKEIKLLGYNYNKCYVCDNNINEDLENVTNKNDFVEINLPNNDINKVYLIKNESIKNISDEKINNLPETISLSTISSNNSYKFDTLVFQIESEDKKSHTYICCTSDCLYNLFICFLFLFLIFCIVILFILF